MKNFEIKVFQDGENFYETDGQTVIWQAPPETIANDFDYEGAAEARTLFDNWVWLNSLDVVFVPTLEA